MAVDLQRLAIQGLLTETALDKNEVDYVIAGNVIQEVRTSNIAREAAINAGLPISIGAHTIAQVRLIFILYGTWLYLIPLIACLLVTAVADNTPLLIGNTC